MSLPALPNLLAETVAPPLLAASAVSKGLLCPLAATTGHAVEASRLPPSNQALLGMVAHHAADNLQRGSWGEDITSPKAARHLYRLATDELDEQLKRHSQCADRAPIRSAVGRDAYLASLEKLEASARNLSIRSGTEPPAPLPDVLAVRFAERPVNDDDTPVEPGTEVPVQSGALRLRGRIDRLQDNGSTVQIVEFKSGRILDDSDRVMEEHQRQLGLYALLVEPHFPSRRIQLFVEGKQRHPVPWDDRIRATRRAELDALLAKMPADKTLRSRELAHPGEHCRWCSMRPSCPGYREHAEAAWSGNDPGHSLPRDVWGRITSIEEHGGHPAWRLVDPTDRQVRILGTGAARFAACRAGDDVALFDLKTHISPPRHARWKPPNGFYIDAVLAGTKRATEAYAFHRPNP